MADAPNSGAAPAAASTPEQSAEKVLATIPDAKGSKTASSEAPGAIDASDASNDELEEVLESDEATPEEKAEAKVELKQRMKFRINGREVERDIDLSDRDALQELLQKGFAADEKFQSASGIEKRMNEYVKRLQADPIQAMIEAGHDPDKLTEEYMKKRVAELSKSPEQLQLEKLQKELEKEREDRKTLEQEKLNAEQAKVEEQYSRQLDDEITSGLASSDLPKSPYVVKRIAENLMLAIEQGYEDVSVQDVLPMVEKQIKDEIRQMFEAMPEDIIEKTLGGDVSNKLRKRRLAKMKAAPEGASSIKQTGTSETNKAKGERKEEAKPVKAKDFFKNF